ncbi:MAG: hypothetical protein AB7V32_05775, partial [Candidatus Berkiella sp.]
MTISILRIVMILSLICGLCGCQLQGANWSWKKPINTAQANDAQKVHQSKKEKSAKNVRYAKKSTPQKTVKRKRLARQKSKSSKSITVAKAPKKKDKLTISAFKGWWS